MLPSVSLQFPFLSYVILKILKLYFAVVIFPIMFITGAIDDHCRKKRKYRIDILLNILANHTTEFELQIGFSLSSVFFLSSFLPPSLFPFLCFLPASLHSWFFCLFQSNIKKKSHGLLLDESLVELGKH